MFATCLWRVLRRWRAARSGVQRHDVHRRQLRARAGRRSVEHASSQVRREGCEAARRRRIRRHQRKAQRGARGGRRRGGPGGERIGPRRRLRGARRGRCSALRPGAGQAQVARATQRRCTRGSQAQQQRRGAAGERAQQQLRAARQASQARRRLTHAARAPPAHGARAPRATTTVSACSRQQGRERGKAAVVAQSRIAALPGAQRRARSARNKHVQTMHHAAAAVFTGYLHVQHACLRLCAS